MSEALGIRCGALITRVYKTVKADSVRPGFVDSHGRGKTPCGGTISVEVSVTQGCCCGESSEIRLDFTCSRCKWPWFEGLPSEYDEENRMSVIEKAVAAYF